MLSLKSCLLLFLAGGFGTLSRFLVSSLVNGLTGRSMPFGTMAVNVIGCFLFGVFWELAAERMLISDQVRVLVCTGFMGGFTTFSSLIFESLALGQIRPLYLAANLSVQIAAGFCALFAGFRAAKFI